MPIYEYECTKCKHKLEVLQKMSDEPLKACPCCHEEALSKHVSAAGFQLKGSGWYATDYKNKAPAPVKETTAEVANKGTASQETVVDKKSETNTG